MAATPLPLPGPGWGGFQESKSQCPPAREIFRGKKRNWPLFAGWSGNGVTERGGHVSGCSSVSWKEPQTPPQPNEFSVTSTDGAPTMCSGSLFPRGPVKGRAAALGLDELMGQWGKPDYVGREQIIRRPRGDGSYRIVGPQGHQEMPALSRESGPLPCAQSTEG